MPYLIYLLLIIYLLFSCYTFYHNNTHTTLHTHTHTLLLYWLLLQFLPSTILQYINIYLYILYKHFCTYNEHHEISTIKKKPTPIHPQQKTTTISTYTGSESCRAHCKYEDVTVYSQNSFKFWRLTNCFLFRLLTLFFKLFLKPKWKLSTVLRTCSYHIRYKYMYT